jgi:hypothetical protein
MVDAGEIYTHITSHHITSIINLNLSNLFFTMELDCPCKYPPSQAG